jgi:hypothetical protein
MSSPQFTELVAEFKAQFRRSTDPVERGELLEKIGLVINELDRVIIKQMAKLQPRESSNEDA